MFDNSTITDKITSVIAGKTTNVLEDNIKYFQSHKLEFRFLDSEGCPNGTAQNEPNFPAGHISDLMKNYDLDPEETIAYINYAQKFNDLLVQRYMRPHTIGAVDLILRRVELLADLDRQLALQEVYH